MLAEQRHNDAAAVLHIGSRAAPLETVLVVVHTCFACISPPQPFKPRRIGRRIHDGMLNISMPQIILNEPRIRALADQGEAARMAQHVRMGIHGQACAFPIAADHAPHRLAAQRAASLTDKERFCIGFHSRTLCQPSLDSPKLVSPERMRGRQALLQACDMQHAAFNVHLGQLQPARLRHAQAMPEHQQE